MKRLRKVSLTVFLVVSLAVFGFVVRTHNAAGPEPSAYCAALADPSVTVTGHDGSITICQRSSYPKGDTLFYPGACVTQEAYVAKLAAISAAAEIQIAIGQPRLNIAVF